MTSTRDDPVYFSETSHQQQSAASNSHTVMDNSNNDIEDIEIETLDWLPVHQEIYEYILQDLLQTDFNITLQEDLEDVENKGLSTSNCHSPTASSPSDNISEGADNNLIMTDDERHVWLQDEITRALANQQALVSPSSSSPTSPSFSSSVSPFILDSQTNSPFLPLSSDEHASSVPQELAVSFNSVFAKPDSCTCLPSAVRHSFLQELQLSDELTVTALSKTSSSATTTNDQDDRNTEAVVVVNVNIIPDSDQPSTSNSEASHQNSHMEIYGLIFQAGRELDPLAFSERKGLKQHRQLKFQTPLTIWLSSTTDTYQQFNVYSEKQHYPLFTIDKQISDFLKLSSTGKFWEYQPLVYTFPYIKYRIFRYLRDFCATSEEKVYCIKDTILQNVFQAHYIHANYCTPYIFRHLTYIQNPPRTPWRRLRDSECKYCGSPSSKGFFQSVCSNCLNYR